MHPAGWALAACLAAWMGISAVGGGRGPRVSGWLLSFLSALLLLNLATASQGLQAARTSALLLAYFLIGLLAARCKEREPRPIPDGDAGGSLGWPMVAIVLAGVALSLHGLYQSLYLFGRIAADAAIDLPEPVRARIASGRAVSTLGLPAALGGFLAMSLPVTAGLWPAVARRSAVRRLALAAALAIQAGGLVATRSMGAVLSLAAASALVLWVRSRVASDVRARTTRRAVAAIAVVGILLASFLLVLRLNAPRSADEGSGPLALRAGNWKVAVEMVADHPFLGVGAGCYGVAFPQYREWTMNESRFAHNTYLQMLAETGGLLGLAFLALMGWLALRLIQGPAPGWRAIACGSFLLHNLVDFTFFLPTLGLVFFWLAGGSGRVTRERSRPSTPLVWTLTALGLGLALFALAVYRSDSALDRARELVAAGRTQEASVAAHRAARANPFDPGSRSFLSHLLLDESLRTGDTASLVEAERRAREATSLDPWTPHLWHHLGRVLLARRDPVGAYLALDRAARLYPIRLEYRDQRDLLGEGLEQRRPRP